MSRGTSPAVVAVVALAAVSGAFATGAAAERSVLEFHRVHVPAGRLGDVPLGADRLVPMPLADFEAAVARARAAAGAAATEPLPPATVARWRAAIDESGRLAGTIACDVGEATAGPGRVLPLGGLRVSRGVLAAEPPREATICGHGAGLAVAIPEPGTYELEFVSAPLAADAAAFRLPLVPALSTTLELDLPPGMRPVLSGPAARRALVAPPAGGAPGPWRIDVAPAADITLAIEPRDQSPPPVAVWADVALSARSAALSAIIVPAAPWRAGRLVLEQDPALRITEIRAPDDDERIEHESAADGRSIAVIVPRWLDGSRTPVVVRGVVPATGPVWRLPLLRAGGNAWVGGGSVVRVDPAFVVRDLDVDDCRVVPPATAASWPRADRAGAGGSGPAAAGAAALYHVEHQGPAATLAVALGPRAASFDVARVTTVEITDGAVLGRAACDVRVTGGEAFEVGARVAPGWIVDAVDAVDPEGETDIALDARSPVPSDRAIDWRVVPSPVGDTLRIDLPAGVVGPDGIGLRITGHRAGLAPGATFTTSDIDMVRFDGEAADAAVIDLRTDADAFVEIDGRPAGWFEVEGRLAALVEEGQARGRILGGDRADDVEARIVRRRPPLEARVGVRLEPRGTVLVQTFTFDCRAAAGVESLVVDFAEPGGDGLAWRVESPADIAVTARPLDPAEGGLASRSDAVAASWLVELRPAATGPVRIRAVRSVPFTVALPVPLAWVEGAVEPGGTVAITAPAGARPRLANRWLRELPPDATTAAPGADFAYGPPLSGVAADLAPVADGIDARAWAWRERVDCWCDESGATESESRFDVENEGRDALSLSLAPGRRLEAVLVDGAAVPDPDDGPAGGTWRVPLPPGQRRVEVVVRTVAAGGPARNAWRVEPAGCGLDVPVLERDVRLLMPPDLVVAMGEPDDARPSWTARLFGVGAAAGAIAAGATAAAGSTGYRAVTVAATGQRGRGVLVISRRRLGGAACVAAALVGVAAFLRGRRRPAAAGMLVVAAAVAALWVPPPFVPMARSAWWGGVVGLAWALRPAWPWPLRWPRRRAVLAACAALVLVAEPAAAADADARVFVTSGSGGDVALVPESLFRALAVFATPEAAAIRLLACRIEAGLDAGAAWRVSIDVDADAGGTVELDAGPGARWLPPAAGPRGLVARVTGRHARLAADAAGRHTVDLAVVPAVERGGAVETAALWMPIAPTSSLRVAAAEPAAGALACERATVGAPFVPAPFVPSGGDATFDLSGADRVRLVRPVDPRDRLAATVRAATTVDTLAWDGGGCGVEAAFDIDTESEWLRSFAVRVDPRLEGLTATLDDGAAPRLEPLGGGRVRVEFAEAVRGRAVVRLAARLPLADPVGVVDAPGIWLEGVPAEKRTTRLSATADLEATLDPPPPAGASAADLAGRAAARVIVRRRPVQLRGAQTLAVSFAPAGARLVLEAQLDATSMALTRIPLDVPVGSTIDRVSLLADDPAEPGARPPVDVSWTRSAPDRVLVVVQRPRPGRFRLEVEARLVRRPAARGRLPLVRARLGPAVPLLVTGAAVPPLVVTLEPAGAAARSIGVEVPEDAAGPGYVLATDEGPAAEPPVPPAHGETEVTAGVDWAEVHAAFDGRGRVHGLARFDVATAAPLVRLRLPPGMRLFDVLVDGRVVAAEPRAVDAWDVPLGAAAWPRTILAVFAGDAGRALADGRPLALAPPELEGLPATGVVWRLRPPAGRALKVAPPARPLEGGALEAARAAAGARIAAACERVAAAAPPTDRLRLEALAALRRAGTGSAAEAAWVRAGGWDDGALPGAITSGTAPVVIRAVPLADATMPARAAATLVLVTTAGLAWTVAARGRTRRDRG